MRKIAMLLAFVLFFSFVPNFNVYEVFAAGPTLNFSMVSSLSTGTNNDNPTYNVLTPQQPTNAWFFNWDTTDKNFDTANLTYQLSANRRVSVTTTKNPAGDFNVVLQAKDDSNNPITVSNYSIYSNFAKDYTPVSNFFDGSGNPDNTYNDYDTKEVLYNSTLNQASFRLDNTSSDVGYSIKYDIYEFHFLLQKDGNFIFYQVGNFNLGNIYEAKFTYDDITGASTSSQRDFCIGIDTSENESRPFVNVASEGYNREYSENKYNISSRSSISVLPADQVGFEYVINLPLKYNPTNKTFTKPMDSKSSINLNFKEKNGTSLILGQMDIAANEASVSKISETVPAGATWSAPTINPTSHQVIIEYYGLESGLILTPSLTYNNNALSIKDTTATNSKAYTFPEYSILKKDGQDYISIVPFKDYAGHYVLYSGLSTPSPNGTTISMSSSYFKENASSTENILLALAPVPVSGKPQDYDYKLFFNPDVRFKKPGEIMLNNLHGEGTIRTRYFNYVAQDAGAIGFPNNFDITNQNQSKMFNPDSNYTADGSGKYVDNYQDVSYTLGWDIGKITSVDKLLASNTTDKTVVVKYVIALGDTLETNAREDFLEIEITIDGNGGTTNAKLTSATGTYLPTKLTTDPNNTLPSTKDPKSILNDFISENAKIVSAYSPQASAYVYRLEVDLANVAIDAVKKADNLEVAKKLYFTYPGIYFFAVRPTEVSIDGAVTTLNSPSSTVQSMTLNKDLSTELQEPVDIEAKNMTTEFKGGTATDGTTVLKDKIAFEVWYKQKQQSLTDFMNYYFTNYDLQHYGQNMVFTNDVYISQDLDLMKNKFPTYTKAERISKSSEIALPDGYTNTNINDNNIPVVMMRELSNNSGVVLPYKDPDPIATSDGNYGIDVLRDGGVVRISNLPLYSPQTPYALPTSDILNKLEINGLDTNTKYYVFVDINAKYDNRILSGSNFEKHSDTSAMVSATTGSNLQTPSIIDEVPTKPEISLVDVGRNNYIIDFDQINMTISDTTRYTQEFQYEVLRLRDTPLKDDYIDTRKDLQHVFKNEIANGYADKSAQLLYEDGTTRLPSVKVYNPATNDFDTPADPNYYLQTYDAPKIVYQDNTLGANKVYFVYARTVRVITDLETGNVYRNYSAWDAVSATTELGDAPVDLKVIYDYTGAYDTETSIPLQFRAKVSDPNTIGSDINFEVTYKYDNLEWVVPITISASQLKSSASDMDADGYRTFSFLLTGLAPGKTYSIKVRQANSDGSNTPYSNIVQWKTDIDEDDYDKEDEVDSFEDLMDDMVDKLIDGSQVIVGNTSKDKIVMINGNNLANEISGSKANTLIIDSLEKGKSNTFIIPIEAYENANKKNLAWQYSYSDMFFNTSAKTLDTTYNSAIIGMNKEIDKDYYEDYYLEVKFAYNPTPNTLQGDEKLTDLVTISANLRAVNQNLLDFQEVELEAILEEVKNAEDVLAKKERILSEIRYKTISNEDAIKLVEEYVAYVEARFQSALRIELDSIKTSYYDERVPNMDKPIIMGTTSPNILNKVTAYTVNSVNVALPLSTTRSKDVSTAVIKEFGTYGFGGNAVTISGNINNANTNSVSNIVAQNDLEGTLSTYGENVVTGEKITVSQALVAASNILDLSVDETKTLLSKKGVSINRNNENKNLTQDLAYAIIGVLYEAENGVNADKIAIKDYKFYEKLKSSKLNQNYIKYIQLCKEVGIISETPSTSKEVTTGDFLAMLTKI